MKWSEGGVGEEKRWGTEGGREGWVENGTVVCVWTSPAHSSAPSADRVPCWASGGGGGRGPECAGGVGERTMETPIFLPELRAPFGTRAHNSFRPQAAGGAGRGEH